MEMLKRYGKVTINQGSLKAKIFYYNQMIKTGEERESLKPYLEQAVDLFNYLNYKHNQQQKLRMEAV